MDTLVQHPLRLSERDFDHLLSVLEFVQEKERDDFDRVTEQSPVTADKHVYLMAIDAHDHLSFELAKQSHALKARETYNKGNSYTNENKILCVNLPHTTADNLCYVSDFVNESYTTDMINTDNDPMTSHIHSLNEKLNVKIVHSLYPFVEETKEVLDNALTRSVRL